MKDKQIPEKWEASVSNVNLNVEIRDGSKTSVAKMNKFHPNININAALAECAPEMYEVVLRVCLDDALDDADVIALRNKAREIVDRVHNCTDFSG